MAKRATPEPALALIDDPLHVGSFVSDHPPGDLELGLVFNLDLESAGVLDVTATFVLLLLPVTLLVVPGGGIELLSFGVRQPVLAVAKTVRVERLGSLSLVSHDVMSLLVQLLRSRASVWLHLGHLRDDRHANHLRQLLCHLGNRLHLEECLVVLQEPAIESQSGLDCMDQMLVGDLEADALIVSVFAGHYRSSLLKHLNDIFFFQLKASILVLATPISCHLHVDTSELQRNTLYALLELASTYLGHHSTDDALQMEHGDLELLTGTQVLLVQDWVKTTIEGHGITRKRA